MNGNYSVQLDKIIKAHSFEVLYLPDKPSKELVVRSQEVNRPGLLFASGYDKYFDKERIEFIGLAETSYLQELDESIARERLDFFFSLKPPAAQSRQAQDQSSQMLLWLFLPRRQRHLPSRYKHQSVLQNRSCPYLMKLPHRSSAV